MDQPGSKRSLLLLSEIRLSLAKHFESEFDWASQARWTNFFWLPNVVDGCMEKEAGSCLGGNISSYEKSAATLRGFWEILPHFSRHDNWNMFLKNVVVFHKNIKTDWKLSYVSETRELMNNNASLISRWKLLAVLVWQRKAYSASISLHAFPPWYFNHFVF